MENFDEKTIIEKISLLRKQYAGNRGKSEFARALGISASTYNYYENNRVPPIEILLKICEVTGADLEWLLTGRSTEKRFAFGANSGLLQKLDDLFTSNPELTEAVLAFIELLCEKKGVEKEFQSKVLPARPDRPGWIPVLGRTAAGMVHFWDQTFLPEPKQAVTELDELVKKHIGKAIIGSVDGMVSIDLQARPLVDGLKRPEVNLIQVSGGHIAIARVANQIGVTCKLIRSTEDAVHLIPINERHETKVVAKKDLLWALAVLCHIGV